MVGNKGANPLREVLGASCVVGVEWALGVVRLAVDRVRVVWAKFRDRDVFWATIFAVLIPLGVAGALDFRASVDVGLSWSALCRYRRGYWAVVLMLFGSAHALLAVAAGYFGVEMLEIGYGYSTKRDWWTLLQAGCILIATQLPLYWVTRSPLRWGREGVKSQAE